MTAPDTRTRAATVLAASLRRAGHAHPDAYALALLADLEGAHIGLVDRTPPDDPNADALTRPTHITPATDATTEYQQAKAALTKARPTARRGIAPPRQCGCGCVRGFCQCAGNPCACAPCPLCHPAPPEPQEGPGQ